MGKTGKKSRKTHAEMRYHVCIYCLKNGCSRKIPESLLSVIKRNVSSDFDLSDESFPIGLCNSCQRKALRDDSYKSDLDYDLLRRRFRALSGMDKICQCYICMHGRVTPFNKVKETSPMVQQSVASPKGDASKLTKTCNKCLQTDISPGKPHDCSISNRVDNILGWLPSDVTEQIASSVISKQMNNNCQNNKSIQLKSKRGRPLKLRMSAEKPERSDVSLQMINQLRQVLRLSGKKALKMNQGIRMITKNKKIIPPNFKEHLANLSKKERSFLEMSKINLSTCPEPKTVVHVKDLGDFIEHVKIERKLRLWKLS